MQALILVARLFFCLGVAALAVDIAIKVRKPGGFYREVKYIPIEDICVAGACFVPAVTCLSLLLRRLHMVHKAGLQWCALSGLDCAPQFEAATHQGVPQGASPAASSDDDSGACSTAGEAGLLVDANSAAQ